jgi:DNA-binding MarR family transcriptional regulator
MSIHMTQFGVLTALAATGEVNQKRLSAGLAMDSTTLTRTMCPLVTSGWVEMKPGQDKRERLFSLTPAGRQQLAEAAPHWERAEKRFRKQMSDTSWREMKESVSRMTEAAANA